MNIQHKRGLSEEVSITDSGKYGGFVILTDNKTGKIIFKRHNMIVNEGKKVLAASLFGHFYDESSNDFTDTSPEYIIQNKSEIDYTDYKLRYLFISDDASETTFDTTYDDIQYSTNLTGKIVTSNGGDYTGYVYSFPSSDVPVIFLQDDSNNKYAIELQLELGTDTVLTSVSSLGLIMANSTSDYLLFSRINFDTIPMADDTTYTLRYYVYV